jgi:nucleotide-binding universal stress UspA family protein
MARDIFKHILVPHDFSEPAAVALGTAAQLAKQHGGKLTVLHVLVLSSLVRHATVPVLTLRYPSGSAVKLARSETAVLVRTGIDRLETR